MKYIHSKIQDEIESFRTDKIPIVKGFKFNQKDTVERAEKYYNSEYESGKFDDQNNRKYFYNIVRNPTNTTAKALDFDTADIRFITAEGGRPIDTWFFERDFKQWFREQDFGKKINKMLMDLAKYGSAVIKTVNGRPYLVDMHNFIIDQGASSLEDANYIIEKHPYSGYRFEKKAGEKDWNNKREVLESFSDNKDSQILVYERYGPVRNEDGTFTYKRTLLADPGDKKNTEGDEGDVDNTVILKQRKFDVEELPYTEFHLEKVKGRWLGKGVPEVLFDPQIRMNELINLQVKASYWASKSVFQTEDEGIGSNLLDGVDNGEVLHVNSEIAQVPTEERNLAAYDNERSMWFKNRNEQSFSSEVMKGERMPSGVPLGATKMAAASAQAYFDMKKENITEDIKNYLLEEIVPHFKKENNKEHILNLTGEDVTQLNKLQKKHEINDAFMNFVEKNGRVPTEMQLKMMKSVSKESMFSEKQQLIPKGLYDNIKYRLKLNITGQEEDISVQAQNLQMAWQAINSNPRALSDPVQRKVLRKMLERAGVSLEDIAPSEEKMPSPKEVAQQRTGGGVSAPKMPKAPTLGKKEKTR